MINAYSKTTTIFFDVGNTLLTPAAPEAETFAGIAAAFGVSLTEASVAKQVPRMYGLYEQLYEHDDSFWSDDARAVAIWHEMYEYLCKLLDVQQDLRPVIAHAVFEHYLLPSSWKTFPDVADALEKLREAGLRLGLISNWDSSLRQTIIGMGMESLFSPMISSADVGCHKPQAKIFELACAQAGASPEQCVHVGDHATADVEGARGTGLTPVYLNRSGKTIPNTVCIASLSELPALVLG